MTLYDDLGVSSDAPAATIRDAYKRAASKAHPDKAGGSEEAFKALSVAYGILSDPAARERYDKTGQTRPPQVPIPEQLLQMMFAKLLDDANFNGDYINQARGLFLQAINNITTASQQLDRDIAKLESLQPRVQATGVPNLFEAMVTGRLQLKRAQLEQQGLELANYKAVLPLLDAYHDVAPTIAPQPLWHVGTGFITLR